LRISNVKSLETTEEEYVVPKEITPLINFDISLTKLELIGIPVREEIFSLTNLLVLNLSRYPELTLSPKIGNLINLENFMIYGSKIAEIPREIGKLTKLTNFCPYTSYNLHYLPYEILKCPLSDFTISIRALYGNYKYIVEPPSFPELHGEIQPLSLQELCAKKVISIKCHRENLNKLPLALQEYINTIQYCSVCNKPFFGVTQKQNYLETDPVDVAHPLRFVRAWCRRRVGNDNVMLLIIACSIPCAGKLAEKVVYTQEAKVGYGLLVSTKPVLPEYYLPK